MFMAGFLYDTSGRATWVAANGPMTTTTQFSGPLLTYSGGQTLTGGFKPATQSLTALGTLSITFTSDTQGTLTWPGGTIPIARFDIVAGGSSAIKPITSSQSGWWWNPAEGGRGFAVEVQGNSMYFAGYMYDTAGNPTWYLSAGPMTGTNSYQGVWQEFGGGQTLTGLFKPAAVVNPNLGTISVQFADSANATVTLPDGRQIPLTRYVFGSGGLLLSAFSPSSAAPAVLVSIAGAGIDPTADLALKVFDDSAYTVTIPLASASASLVTASVPPYFNPVSGAFISGPVKLQATQTVNATVLTSNVLSGFTIQVLPSSGGTTGSAALSLLVANLAEAQRLQTAISGTSQDSPAISAAIATQVQNLQTLVTGVQGVVQQGLSFTLGVVGGVNITVTQNNIADVDNLILATLQALVNPVTVSSQKGPEAAGSACLGTEASAFAQGINARSGNLNALAQALVAAPGSSQACGTAANFGAAYRIFGGAGNAALGLANGAGTASVATRLPGVAMFATANQHAQATIGLNALINASLQGEAADVKAAISRVSSLAKTTRDSVVARSTGTIAQSITQTQSLTDTIAPGLPPGFPASLPAGNYSLSFSYCVNTGTNTCYPEQQLSTFAATDAYALAAQLTSVWGQVCSIYGSSGVSCGTQSTAFDGAKFQVALKIMTPTLTAIYTYIVRKI